MVMWPELPTTSCRTRRAELARNDVIWDELLSADVLERLLVSDTAELVVSVRGLATENFQFERVMALFGWEHEPKEI